MRRCHAIEQIQQNIADGHTVEDVCQYAIFNSQALSVTEAASTDDFDDDGWYQPPVVLIAMLYELTSSLETLEEYWARFSLYWYVDRQERPLYANGLFMRHVLTNIDYDSNRVGESDGLHRLGWNVPQATIVALIAEGYDEHLIRLAGDHFGQIQKAITDAAFIQWFKDEYPLEHSDSSSEWFPSKAETAALKIRGYSPKQIKRAASEYRNLDSREMPFQQYVSTAHVAGGDD